MGGGVSRRGGGFIDAGERERGSSLGNSCASWAVGRSAGMNHFTAGTYGAKKWGEIDSLSTPKYNPIL